MDLLPAIDTPGSLAKLKTEQLVSLAAEIRQLLVETVARTGGHLAPNLGVVELTIALHATFHSPVDKIVWDVGHQCYIRKLLTGRREQFKTLRQLDGLSGFPKPRESEHDAYATGHSSTSISAALGMAKARDLKGSGEHIIAVIGDGALTGGLAYEALNHAGHLKTRLIIVLNDNEMSIGHNVGGMSVYLNRLRSDPKYSRLKEELEVALRRIPAIGPAVVKSAERLKDALKYILVPGIIFEELGIKYLGPVDGHNIAALRSVFQAARQFHEPVLVHVLTRKGKGYRPAEINPDLYHGIGPFHPASGAKITSPAKPPTYTETFGDTVLQLARDDRRIVAVTPAMGQGTGLEKFAREFPDRFFDVAIAEQHAVVFACGLATAGYRPIVAVYSTFLQRAYDQVLHDICLQQLPVILAIDRAGIVGEDGETHQGLFDIAFLRSMPHMALMAPKDENELRHMLKTALAADNGPMAIRYPRSSGQGVPLTAPVPLPFGRAELLRQGDGLAIIALGTMVAPSLQAAELLRQQGIEAAVVNARFAKPLDRQLIVDLAQKCRHLLTVEEGALAGGFGSAILELLQEEALSPVKIDRLGIPNHFVDHGPRELMLERYGLNAQGIRRAALRLCREAVKPEP